MDTEFPDPSSGQSFANVTQTVSHVIGNVTHSFIDYVEETWHHMTRHNTILQGSYADWQHVEDIANGIMCILCVVCAAVAAGLTMGLLSLDISKLEIKAMVGNAEEKEAALRLLPIIKQHHLLLVTLLLSNSIANEALPIFLGELVPNWVAVLLSVTFIFLFGEILPTALFTGPNQLSMASKMYRVVLFLMAFLYPIAYPVSLMLDWMFGSEEKSHTMVNRSDLDALIQLQMLEIQQLEAAEAAEAEEQEKDQSDYGSEDQDRDSNFPTSEADGSSLRLGQSGQGALSTVVEEEAADRATSISPPEVELAKATSTGQAKAQGREAAEATHAGAAREADHEPRKEPNSTMDRQRSVSAASFSSAGAHGASNMPALANKSPRKSASFASLLQTPSSLSPTRKSTQRNADTPSLMRTPTSMLELHLNATGAHSTTGDKVALRQSEMSIMSGIVQLAGATLADTMIPIEQAYMLPIQAKLDKSCLLEITQRGYSRIPVFNDRKYGDRDNTVDPSIDQAGNKRNSNFLIGYVLARSLIEISAEDDCSLSKLPIRQALVVRPSISLLTLLEMFKEGRCHIAFVSTNPLQTMRRMREEEASFRELEEKAAGGSGHVRTRTFSFGYGIDETIASLSSAASSAASAVGGAASSSPSHSSASASSSCIVGMVTLHDVLQRMFSNHGLFCSSEEDHRRGQGQASPPSQGYGLGQGMHTPVRSSAAALRSTKSAVFSGAAPGGAGGAGGAAEGSYNSPIRHRSQTLADVLGGSRDSAKKNPVSNGLNYRNNRYLNMQFHSDSGSSRGASATNTPLQTMHSAPVGDITGSGSGTDTDAPTRNADESTPLLSHAV